MPSFSQALSAAVLASAASAEAFVAPLRVLPTVTTSTSTYTGNVRNCKTSLSMHGGHHLSAERKAELVATATAMSQFGKGLTACDEGPGTIGDRFEKVMNRETSKQEAC